MRAAEIVFARDSRTAYVLDTDGFGHVIDVETMQRRMPLIQFDAPQTGQGQWRGRTRRTFASLSPSGDILVVNGGFDGGLRLIHVKAGRATTVPIDG